ncbi:MAG: helix-turn-helix domain-containing protein, partial [Gemmatimonadetes bacterium]|nr:helix-turn-helix domain-containing protein [Gemmatimonadota bacterium]
VGTSRPGSASAGAGYDAFHPEAEVVEVDEDDAGGHRTAADFEKEAIRRALREAGGNRRRAARILGIGERTLYRKLKLYELGR